MVRCHLYLSLQLLVISSTVCLVILRLSVRAFTKLFDEDREEFLSPLFTDTYLSKPLMTDAGITRGLLY